MEHAIWQTVSRPLNVTSFRKFFEISVVCWLFSGRTQQFQKKFLFQSGFRGPVLYSNNIFVNSETVDSDMIKEPL